MVSVIFENEEVIAIFSLNLFIYFLLKDFYLFIFIKLSTTQKVEKLSCERPNQAK